MEARELLGVTLVAAGFLAVFDRTVASVFTLNGLFVAGVGLLAVVLGLNYFNSGREAERRSTPIEDVEPRYEVPVPGDETDETLSVVTGFSPNSIRNRREFHKEIRSVAVETLSARGDYTDSAAVEDALRGGSWTDDPVAAWFLGETESPPLTVRLRGLLGADTEFAFAAKRTIAALVDARGLDLDDGAETSGDDPDGESTGSTDEDAEPGRVAGTATGRVADTGQTTATGPAARTATPTGDEQRETWRVLEDGE